jgi:hypothetical protein
MNDTVPAYLQKKETNPKDEAAAGTRLDLSLFPDTAIIYGALAMTEGHLKYGGHNYRVAGVKSSVYISAMLRHFKKWVNGEDADQKTKVPHLASAEACIAILIDATECGKLIDDRPPKVTDIAELFDWAEKITQHLHETFPPEDGPGRFTEEGQRESKTNSPSSFVHDSFNCGSGLPNSSGD